MPSVFALLSIPHFDNLEDPEISTFYYSRKSVYQSQFIKNATRYYTLALQESGLKVTNDHGEIKLLNQDLFQQYTFSLSSNPMRRQHDFFHLNYYKKILK